MSIQEFSISNEHLEVKIKRKGAELCSVKSRKNGFEFIWQAGSEWERHAPILFPVVGSLLDHQYIMDDKTYDMRHHGFARDTEFDPLHQSEHAISFVLTHSNSSLRNYPFAFSFIVSYSLDGPNLHQSFRVINESLKSMPVSFGGHPAFNAEPITEYYLEFEQDESITSNRLSGPYINNQTLDVIRENSIQLTDTIFNDDALIFQGLNSKSVALKHKSKSHSVELSFDGWPYLGIWSKPNAPFVCIEPWQGLADLVEHNKNIWEKKGVISLAAGEQIKRSFSIKFTI
ncbi:MAG: aldose 1-epimerase family protein [Bacteroidia bacterium]